MGGRPRLTPGGVCRLGQRPRLELAVGTSSAEQGLPPGQRQPSGRFPDRERVPGPGELPARRGLASSRGLAFGLWLMAGPREHCDRAAHGPADADR